MSEARTVYHLLIPNVAGEVLVARDAGGCRLPAVACPGDWLAEAAETVRAGLRTQLGLEATVLRQVPGGGAGCAYAEMESQAAGWAPAGPWTWLSPLELEASGLAASHREVVAAWWRQPATGGTPWERRGWFAEAVDWIDEQLSARGWARVGPVRQVKAAWAGSAVLFASTGNGGVYLKAAAGLSSEARVVSELARRWPEDVPEVLAVDDERDWLLTRDMEGTAIPPEAQPAALRRFAEIQIGEASFLSRWRELGCIQRGPDVLAAATERALVEVPRILARGGVIPESEAQELARFRPRAVEVCGRLSALGLPLSIHHEDFQAGNVMLSRGRLVYIDWGDTVIAHPFFSLQRFLDFVPPAPGRPRWDWRFDGDDAAARLRDAYLEPWTRLAPEAAVREAFVLTRQLQGLYEALRNDTFVDFEAWLRAGPPPAEIEFARGVVAALLGASRADPQPVSPAVRAGPA